MADKPKKLQKTVTDQQRFAFKELADFEHAHVVVLSEDQLDKLVDNNQLLMSIHNQLRIMNFHLSSMTDMDLDEADLEG